jgi:hypothetical protein
MGICLLKAEYRVSKNGHNVCVCACFFAIVIFAPKEIVILVQNIGDQTALTKGDLPIYWHR